MDIKEKINSSYFRTLRTNAHRIFLKIGAGKQNAGVKREGKISWNTSVLNNWENTFGFNRNSKVWETKYCFKDSFTKGV